MKRQILYFFVLLIISVPVIADNNSCIEPRNHFSQDSIYDIQWSVNDNAFYIMTMGKIWVYEVDGEQAPKQIQNVCEDRFPIIEVAEDYYAVGSDFLPTLSIYDLETDQLLYEIDTTFENTRSIAFAPSDDVIALSLSNYDEGGFFDIDRTVQIWNYRTGEVLAELAPIQGNAASVYLPVATSVDFLSDDTLLIAGIDLENAWVLSQPMVYLWNWQTDVIESVDIETDTIMEVIGSELAIVEGYEAPSINVQPIHLTPNFQFDTLQQYDISLEVFFETRLSGNAEESLLAIESREGDIWVVDLEKEEIVFSRRLEHFASVVAFDHSGQNMALGYADGTFQIWDLETDTITTIGNVFEG